MVRCEPDFDRDRDILTREDIYRSDNNQELLQYDAFVLFAEEDIEFVTKLLDIMEREYNLRLCAKERDLVGGSMEQASMIQLISRRCNRLIAIISTAFLSSAQNQFFLNFAQFIGIGEWLN